MISTEREKIISFAKEFSQCYSADSATLTFANIVDIWEMARDEALEDVIQYCVQAEQESADAKNQLSDEEYIAKAVASGAIYQAKKLQANLTKLKETK